MALGVNSGWTFGKRERHGWVQEVFGSDFEGCNTLEHESKCAKVHGIVASVYIRASLNRAPWDRAVPVTQKCPYLRNTNNTD